MATLSDLVTRFYNRVGITSASTVQAAQVKEALNAAALRAAGDGVPGIAVNYFVGEQEGSSSLTISSHTPDDTDVVFSSVPDSTLPGDIVEFGSDRRIVYTVDIATETLGFGSAIRDAKTGTATIYQRTVPLPSPGPVLEVLDLTDLTKLKPTADGISTYGLNDYTGIKGYEQMYDGTTAYLVIWPVVDTTRKFAIKQMKSLTTMNDSTDLPWPDETLDTVLSRAVQIWRTYRTGGISPVEANLGKDDIRDSGSSRRVSSPAQPRVRENGLRRR